MFALRAWTERDEMRGRIHASPLFRTELAGPCEAARRAWGLAEGEPADWVAGVVPHGAEKVRQALAGRERDVFIDRVSAIFAAQMAETGAES